MQEPDGQPTEALEITQPVEAETMIPEQTTDAENVLEQEPEVESPVQPVVEKKSPSKVGKRILLSLLGLTFIGGVAFGTHTVLSIMQPMANDDSSKSAKDTASTSTKPSSSEADQSITSSLDNIDTSISQGDSDQANVDSALSDSDNQITVPTE